MEDSEQNQAAQHKIAPDQGRSDSDKPLHDNLFRGALENPMVAEELLRTHLPANIYSMIDKSSLQIENESFIEKDLSEKITDVLFSAKINDQTGYIYLLLEHQSTPDFMMAYRLFKYMLCICERHMKQFPDEKKLPLVYPMLIYNGRKKYNVARNIWDLFENKDLAKQFWSDEDYKLLNLQEIPDEEIKERVWWGLVEFFMKHIHETKNLAKRWEEVPILLRKIIDIKSGQDHIKMILYYTLKKIPEEDKMGLENFLKSTLSKEQGEKIMPSIADSYIREGIKLGEARGEARGEENKALQIAAKMLSKGVDIATISEFTGLDKEIIAKLKRHTKK